MKKEFIKIDNLRVRVSNIQAYTHDANNLTIFFTTPLKSERVGEMSVYKTDNVSDIVKELDSIFLENNPLVFEKDIEVSTYKNYTYSIHKISKDIIKIHFQNNVNTEFIADSLNARLKLFQNNVFTIDNDYRISNHNYPILLPIERLEAALIISLDRLDKLNSVSL